MHRGNLDLLPQRNVDAFSHRIGAERKVRYQRTIDYGIDAYGVYLGSDRDGILTFEVPR
jgi:hypothetical protein